MKYGRKVVGTCSICRGPVEETGFGKAKILHCHDCGATKGEDYGPVIQMDEPRRWSWDNVCGVMYEVK